MSVTPRNVLFITADQWRGECLSAAGHAVVRTPCLDALAADGVLYRRHYAQATPCGPSRASLYTGLYLHNHRSVVNGTPLDARHTNVALEARKAGYEPVLFGYTDVSADPRSLPSGDPALRSYAGVLPGMVPAVWTNGEMQPWFAYLKRKGYDLRPDELFRAQDDYPGAEERGATFAPARFAAEDSAAAFLTGEVLDYLSVRHTEPWFVHLSYLSPHPPFIAPEPYHAMYDPADVTFPVRAATPDAEARQHPYLDFYLHHQRDSPYSFGKSTRDNLRLDERELRQLRATYYGMMSEVDRQIGRLTAFLRESGLYDSTLVVFVSDHGEQLGDHWQLSKLGYFEQTFHVPLIVRDPDRAADAARGSAVEAFTENVDVMPTVLDWLGLGVPAACDGESLLPFCRGQEQTQWREQAHFELDFRNFRDAGGNLPLGLKPDQCSFAAVRGKRYKYVHFTALPALLFDLQEDPWEFRNLAADPGHRELVLEYAQMLLSWRMNHAERALANLRLTPQGVVSHSGRRR